MELFSDRFPRESWYALTRAAALRRGRSVAVDALGLRLLVAREDTGRVRVLERICPHMGAELPVGRLRSGRIVCPFHGWSFALDGSCAAIPYAERIPATARIRSFPAEEHYGWVWMYTGDSPTHKLPDLSEYGAPGCVARHSSIRLRAHMNQVLENAADPPHMSTVHRAPVLGSRVDEIREIDVQDALEISVDYDMAFPWKRRSTRVRVTSRLVGASVIVGTLEHDGALGMRFVAAPLPISARETLLHQTIVRPRRLPRALGWLEAPLVSAFAQMVWHQTRADRRVWAGQDLERPRVLLPCEAPVARIQRHIARHL